MECTSRIATVRPCVYHHLGYPRNGWRWRHQTYTIIIVFALLLYQTSVFVYSTALRHWRRSENGSPHITQGNQQRAVFALHLGDVKSNPGDCRKGALSPRLPAHSQRGHAPAKTSGANALALGTRVAIATQSMMCTQKFT